LPCRERGGTTCRITCACCDQVSPTSQRRHRGGAHGADIVVRPRHGRTIRIPTACSSHGDGNDRVCPVLVASILRRNSSISIGSAPNASEICLATRCRGMVRPASIKNIVLGATPARRASSRMLKRRSARNSRNVAIKLTSSRCSRGAITRPSRRGHDCVEMASPGRCTRSSDVGVLSDERQNDDASRGVSEWRPLTAVPYTRAPHVTGTPRSGQSAMALQGCVHRAAQP
jgi:hypothetical protein